MEVSEEGKRKEEDISRKNRVMSKDSQIEKNMRNSKNNEEKYRNEFREIKIEDSKDPPCRTLEPEA